MRTVYLWADHDAPGRGHMATVGERLVAIEHPDVRVIVWPDAPPKGDAADLAPLGGEAAVRELMVAAGGLELLSAALKNEIPAERNGLRFRTGREVAALLPAKPEWLLTGYIAKRSILELDGRAKAGGKTTWVMAACRKILDGAPFMGLETARSPVVYLSEQSPASLYESLRRADLLDRDDFVVLAWPDAIGTDWPLIVTAAANKADEIGADLLVIDTHPQWAGLRGDAENNAGEALASVQPLQEVAALHGKAVVMVRHERKGGGPVGDSGRGSSAFAGAVDIIVSIQRVEGAPRPTIRHLAALSRFDETPETLVIELTDAGYVALGTETAVAEAEARTAVLDAAPASEATAMTEAALLEAAGVKRTVGQQAIRDHREAGRLIRSGAGKRGDPYRYWSLSEGDEKVSAGATERAAETNGDDAARSGAVRPEQAALLSAGTPSLKAAEGNERPGNRQCVHCGTRLPDGWTALYCERHGGKPTEPDLFPPGRYADL